MAFEKEKRNNNILMASGAIIAAVGLLLYFLDHPTAGVLVLILGVSMVVISWSISSVFYKIQMKELMESRKRSK